MFRFADDTDALESMLDAMAEMGYSARVQQATLSNYWLLRTLGHRPEDAMTACLQGLRAREACEVLYAAR